MFKANEGKTDRIIRIVAGILAMIISTLFLSGGFGTFITIIGVVSIITGFGINTCPVKIKKTTKK